MKKMLSYLFASAALGCAVTCSVLVVGSRGTVQASR